MTLTFRVISTLIIHHTFNENSIRTMALNNEIIYVFKIHRDVDTVTYRLTHQVYLHAHTCTLVVFDVRNL